MTLLRLLELNLRGGGKGNYMEHVWNNMKTAINRRSFVKKGLTAAGVAQ
jgi:hypothetical protein